MLHARFSHVYLNMNFVLDMLRENYEVLPRIFLRCAKSEWLHAQVISQADVGDGSHSQISV